MQETEKLDMLEKVILYIEGKDPSLNPNLLDNRGIVRYNVILSKLLKPSLPLRVDLSEAYQAKIDALKALEE